MNIWTNISILINLHITWSLQKETFNGVKQHQGKTRNI